jgi:hypothetical protein
MVTLADIRTRAMNKCEESNFAYVSEAEWNDNVNASIGALYEIIANTNQDYNVEWFPFTLTGGSTTTNFLDLTTLPSLGYPPYWKVRQVEGMIPGAGGADPWKPLKSIPVRDKHRFSQVAPYSSLVGPFRAFVDYGSRIEIVPAVSSPGSYQMLYIPQAPTLVNDTDSIDGYWLAVNNWHEWVALDVAIKFYQKEGSDTSTLFMQKQALEALIIKSATARNAAEPKKIADVGNGGFGSGGGFGGFSGGW